MEKIISELVESGIAREDVIRKVDEYKNDAKGLWSASVIAKSELECKLIFNLLLEFRPSKQLTLRLPSLITDINTLKLLAKFISTTKDMWSVKLEFESPLSTGADLLYEAMENRADTTYTIVFNDTTVSFRQDIYSNKRRIILGCLRTPQDSTTALIEYISNTSKIYTLEFEDGTFDSKSTQLLLDAIRKNKSIGSIISKIGKSDDMIEALLEATVNSNNLESLSMFRLPSTISSFLAKNTSLTSLTIDLTVQSNLRQYLTMDVIASLVEGLKQNSTLRELNIYYGDINDLKISKLSEAWSQGSKIRLRSINLEGNLISIDGFKALLTAWQNAPVLVLKEIRARDNFDIDSEGQKFVEQWIQNNPSVEEMNCSWEWSDSRYTFFPKISEMCQNNAKRNKIIRNSIVPILIIARTLFRSDFILLIHEESLVLDILYYCQQKMDNDNILSLNRAQINRIWQYAVTSKFGTRQQLIDFVL